MSGIGMIAPDHLRILLRKTNNPNMKQIYIHCTNPNCNLGKETYISSFEEEANGETIKYSYDRIHWAIMEIEQYQYMPKVGEILDFTHCPKTDCGQRTLKRIERITKPRGLDRSLIIKKEWLDLILDGGKVWEMRSFKTKITGRVGLIESGTGLIVGEVEIIGSCPHPVKADNEFFEFHKVKDSSLLKKWCYAWLLQKAIRYKDPIKYDHKQGAVIFVKHD